MGNYQTNGTKWFSLLPKNVKNTTEEAETTPGFLWNEFHHLVQRGHGESLSDGTWSICGGVHAREICVPKL